jgi:hypothetical protein
MPRFKPQDRARIVKAAKAMPGKTLRERAALLGVKPSTLSGWMLAEATGLTIGEYRRLHWTSEPGYCGPVFAPDPVPAPAVSAPAAIPQRSYTAPLFEEGDGSVQPVAPPVPAPAPAAPRILMAPDLTAVVASILVISGKSPVQAVETASHIVALCQSHA